MPSSSQRTVRRGRHRRLRYEEDDLRRSVCVTLFVEFIGMLTGGVLLKETYYIGISACAFAFVVYCTFLCCGTAPVITAPRISIVYVRWCTVAVIIARVGTAVLIFLALSAEPSRRCKFGNCWSVEPPSPQGVPCEATKNRCERAFLMRGNHVGCLRTEEVWVIHPTLSWAFSATALVNCKVTPRQPQPFLRRKHLSNDASCAQQAPHRRETRKLRPPRGTD